MKLIFIQLILYGLTSQSQDWYLKFLFIIEKTEKKENEKKDKEIEVGLNFIVIIFRENNIFDIFMFFFFFEQLKKKSKSKKKQSPIKEKVRFVFYRVN